MQNFLAGFAHKINLLKLAGFAAAVGKQMADPEVSLPARPHVAAAAAAAAESTCSDCDGEKVRPGLGRACRRSHLRLRPRASPPALRAPPRPQKGTAFVSDVIANLEASKQPDTEQPVLFLRMQIAQYRLLQARQRSMFFAL